jgi:pyruvate formate lyase activating enzyme
MKASIDSIETMGLVDGPGIRVVIFFNGCKLRCKYCHNPETWVRGKDNMTVDEVYNKIMRCEPYFRNNGGVTFSGGEPLLHSEFIIELSKKLKENNIHICLDTAGVGNGNYDELLSYIDIVLLDIKHTNSSGYKYITGKDIKYQEEFIQVLNRLNKKVWIRQVVVPGITDSREYMLSLKEYLKKIDNVERIDLLPYHTMAIDKYKTLGIKYPLEGVPPMDQDRLKDLYKILEED